MRSSPLKTFIKYKIQQYFLQQLFSFIHEELFRLGGLDKEELALLVIDTEPADLILSIFIVFQTFLNDCFVNLHNIFILRTGAEE